MTIYRHVHYSFYYFF